MVADGWGLPAVFDWPPWNKWALAGKYYFAPEFMATRMSALGQCGRRLGKNFLTLLQTFRSAIAMSALPRAP